MSEFIATNFVHDTIRCFDKNGGAEVLRIAADGRIYWRGREVETDDDFRTAMLELRAALMGSAARDYASPGERSSAALAQQAVPEGVDLLQKVGEKVAAMSDDEFAKAMARCADHPLAAAPAAPQTEQRAGQAPAEGDGLPELPKPYQDAITATAKNTPAVRAGYEEAGYEKSPNLYTAEQMHNYARAAITSNVQPKGTAEPVARAHVRSVTPGRIDELDVLRPLPQGTHLLYTGPVQAPAPGAESVELPAGLARSDAEFWLRKRGELLSALAAHGLTMVTTVNGVQLFRLGKVEARTASPAVGEQSNG